MNYFYVWLIVNQWDRICDGDGRSVTFFSSKQAVNVFVKWAVRMKIFAYLDISPMAPCNLLLNILWVPDFFFVFDLFVVCDYLIEECLVWASKDEKCDGNTAAKSIAITKCGCGFKMY